MNERTLRRATLGAICLAAATLCALPAPLHAAPAPEGKTRTYYVAADEVNWDYAPSGRDEAMGMPFDSVAKGFTETSADHIGRVYKKAVYREYTDATFTTIKPRAAQDAYLGIVGPILYAEVGDTIKVVFKNNATHPYGCILTVFATRRTPRARTTTAAAATWKTVAPALRPEPRTPTPGKSPTAQDPAPTIPVPCSGSTTRTATSCAM